MKPKVGLWRRFVNWIFRLFFILMHGKGAKRQEAEEGAGPASRLSFTLRMEAGGPMGPMVNAMLAPALMPAAEDLANKIAGHLERTHKAG